MSCGSDCANRSETWERIGTGGRVGDEKALACVVGAGANTGRQDRPSCCSGGLSVGEGEGEGEAETKGVVSL